MLVRYLLDRVPFGRGLPIAKSRVESIRCETGAEPWHTEAIVMRWQRPYASVATRWLGEILPAGSRVFEPGCGSGANLFWLGLRAGHKLYGSDISETALAMAKRLSSHFQIPIELWQDDGLNPAKLPEGMDGIVSVNWLYHVPGASLEDFLATYRPTLNMGGFVAVDMVTKAYNKRFGNQWHSDDLNLPEEQRRPSEYKIHLDKDEVRGIASRCGFSLERDTCFRTKNPQRAVYLLRRVE